MKMLVIADDFTGANDTGVQFAMKGARTDVLLQPGMGNNRHADVIVINTESRACDASTAAIRVKKALSDLTADREMPLVYKKIDSTFRGNVGAEITAAMQATSSRLAIIAAAIPATGRVTLCGKCLVNQVPVHLTEFASDPKTPVKASRIATILAEQTSLPIREIHLSELHDPTFGQTLSRMADKEPAIVVIDALTEGDLTLVAQAALRLTERYLLVGAAGLANALPPSLYLTHRARLPMLIVAGSMSETTRRQVISIEKEEQLQIVDIDVAVMLDDTLQLQREKVIASAVDILRQRQHCVLRTCRDERDRERIEKLCQQWQLSRQHLGETISRGIAEITLAILSGAQVGSLFLTGGDIAIAVARILNAQGYRIAGEIAPCIPWGTFSHSDIEDLPVITKAGGFGEDDVMRKAIWYIEEMYSEEE